MGENFRECSPVLAAPNVNAPAAPVPKFSWRDEFLFIIKASRPGFWLTAIWFYMLPLAQRPLLRTFDFWFGVAFVSFMFGLFIYGWNDIGDVDDDRFNTRKGNF